MKPEIKAKNIIIGEDVTFGDNVKIDVKETFKVGARTHIGPNSIIEGRNVVIGQDVYNSGGLRLGLKRKPWPKANFYMGNRCTFHNNFFDLADEVKIGNDVGLSPDVTFYNHGYWLSVFEGYPTKRASIVIGNRVIIGYRSLVLPGVKVGDNVVVGGQSVISKDLEDGWIYAGDPIRKIREITPLEDNERRRIFQEIVTEYTQVLDYRGRYAALAYNYPRVDYAGCTFDLLAQTITGSESNLTDDFRDFLFRFGIRIYTKRPFKIYDCSK